MKKFLAILFSVFYFGLSSGAVFSTHYCMNELVSVGQNVSDTCNICNTKTKNDCCKTEFKVLKTDQAQKANLLKLSFEPVFIDFIQHYFVTENISFSETQLSSLKIKAPPESRAVPIFIQYCNFRI